MSANYSTESLKAKLSKLNGTQESIQGTSYWFVFHSKHAKESVETWARELRNCQSSRKLFYLYLANDVLQQAKKKGNQFSQAFEKVLPEVFESTFKHSHSDVRQKVKKVLNVWRDRKVYNQEFCEVLEGKAGLRNVSNGSNSPNADENDEEDEEKSGASFILPEQLKGLADNMAALNENEQGKLIATTNVNKIQSKLFRKEEWLNVHDKTELEKVAGDISTALVYLGNVESVVSTEMATRENIKRNAVNILLEQDNHLQVLAGHHRDIIEKQELLKAHAQEIVNRLSFSSGSFFAIPPKVVADLNNAHVVSVSAPAPASVSTESVTAPMLENSAAAAAAPTPYQHGVHPATLDRLSYSLVGQEDEFEL